MIIRLFFKIFNLGVYYQIYGKEDDEILIRQNGLSPDEVSGTGVTQQHVAGGARGRAVAHPAGQRRPCGCGRAAAAHWALPAALARTGRPWPRSSGCRSWQTLPG